MPTSDRIPPEYWPDCIGFQEWYFPFEQPEPAPQNPDRPETTSEFWPEPDLNAYPYFPYQLERPQ